jgi:beta-hydroxylase
MNSEAENEAPTYTMINETVLDTSVATSPSGNLRHRRHTLNPNRTLLDRAGIAAQTGMEWAIARVSPLGDPHIYNTGQFPWVGEVEREWRCVRKELDAVMTFRDQMPSFQDILKEVGAIQSDNNWKTFFLAGIGMDCAENRKHCPETVRLLGKIPGMTTAFFSILSPGKHIPAHRGAWNGILRLHLGLMVPEPRERVRIRIGNDFYSWREGEALIFDDTFNHEVWNETSGYRVVLFVDFARPLYQPFHWLNRRLLSVGALAPFLREAGEKQKRWQDAFWKKKPM